MGTADNKIKVWELATKFFLITYPVVVSGICSWVWWVSVKLVHLEATYVTQKALSVHVDEVEARFDELPPKEWVDRLDKVDVKIDKMFDELVNLRVLVARITPKPEHNFE